MALNTIKNSTNNSCVNLKTGFCNDSALLDLDQNNGTSDDQLELHILISSLILFLSTVMTIIFNGSILYCILKNRKNQWVKSARQIVYLILSDLIVGFLLLPRNALIFLRTTGLSYSTCATFSYMFITTQSVSFYHIMAVCIHRYRLAIRIHVPMGGDRYNYGRESWIIWIGVMLAYLPPYVFWGRHGEVIFKCLFGYIFGPMDAGAKIYILVLYIIPWITTNLLYIFVLFKVKKSLKRVHAMNTDSNVSTNSDSSTSHTAQANKKILRTVGFLLLTFNASIMVTMVIVFGTLFETVVPRIFQAFVLINNICNPFIYMTASSKLKKETYKILSCLRCKCKVPWIRQV